jgi:pimeloyl-ACP methyl ester carboxylesterase
LIGAKGLNDPIVVGHSWGGDVALELAAAYPGLAGGLCFIDGGMIEPSTRHKTLEEAREQMAPPVFTGVSMEDFRERIRPRTEELGPGFETMVLANFETLEDGTIRAKLGRDNHIRIIEALWEHHPSALFPQVSCPALIMPARQQRDAAGQQRALLRADTVAAAESLLPKGKTVWLEDSIHDVPIQRPELVAEVIKSHVDSGYFD